VFDSQQRQFFGVFLVVIGGDAAVEEGGSKQLENCSSIFDRRFEELEAFRGRVRAVVFKRNRRELESEFIATQFDSPLDAPSILDRLEDKSLKNYLRLVSFLPRDHRISPVRLSMAMEICAVQ
jgi:hypothetical protein